MLLMFFQSLLIAVFVSDISDAVIFYVKPDYGDNISNCPFQHCPNYYANISLDHFSVLYFLSGEFILSSDLMIKDVHNISLIGSKGDNSVVNTIIQCNSSFSVIMSNITGLTVRNIIIRNCGAKDEKIAMMRTYNNTRRKHAVVLNYCASVFLEEFTIITNSNPSLLAINLIGNYFMVNITIDSFILCDISKYGEHSDLLEINTFSCADNVTIFCKIKFLFSLENFSINITILNAVFSYYRDFKLISITGNSIFYYMIHIKHSYFIHNQIKYILSTSAEWTDDGIIKFSNCMFYHNSMLNSNYLISTTGLDMVSWVDCIFNKNNNLVLFLPNFQVKDVIFKNTSFSCGVHDIPLISVYNTNFIFYGPIKFINNTGKSYLFNASTVTFICYNYVGILYNHVKGFLHSYYRAKISLTENTTLEIIYNIFSDYFAISSQSINEPYPYCFFQYYSEENHDKIWHQGEKLNYSISFIDNYMKPLPYSYVAECDWTLSSDFKEVIPLEINKHIIEYKNRWHMPFISANDRDICFCEKFSNFSLIDCKVDKLGPIYPGETLNSKFSLSFYRNLEIDDEFIYEEFDVLWKRQTTCQFDAVVMLNFVLTSRHCSMSNLEILATHKRWCALVLYNNDHDDNNPGVFYVMLYPGCPMGFAKYSNKCDCDKVLGILFTFTCDINDRTILRPSNSWISATTNNYTHNYTICQVCPFDYCLPQSSHLHLSHPNSQCQFNRSGLLCGQCQKGLSTVFGSSECEHCSNVYLLLSLLFAVLGILLVFVLFTINITVTDGTINGFVFYANIVSINGTIFFPFHKFSYVFISISNLDLGIKTCFYNGMDDYTKMWLQLAFPVYLILIAASLIMGSRYSTRIQRLTARRALPVLATLFLLSYTKMLRTTCNVLFLYSRVIYLPSNKTKLMWSVDTNVPLFEVKFIILFITCLVLFSIMIPFNIILLFTRFFLRFRQISKFKPLIDAYQGAYKDNCYYWIGIHLVVRAVFLGLSSLDRTVNLTVGIILISILAGVHGLLRPFKSKYKNYQEQFWLINLHILHVLSFGVTNMMHVNILVIIAMLHFSIVIVYHVMTYSRIGKTMCGHILSGCSKIFTFLNELKSCKSKNVVISRKIYEIPDITFNYREFQEPLVEL